MELHDALNQISEIRQRMAQGQVFRGYRSATTAFTAVVAVVTAWVQARWVPDPWRTPDAYLYLWLGAAVVSLLVVGGEMALRVRRSGSPLQRQITLMAVDQFVPSLVAGALLTYVIAVFAHDALWMLPGLWAILFGLGVFASRRFLPRGIGIVGGFYLLAGLRALTLAREIGALSPWTMALNFGVGQTLAAVILYWTLERRHAPEE